MALEIILKRLIVCHCGRILENRAAGRILRKQPSGQLEFGNVPLISFSRSLITCVTEMGLKANFLVAGFRCAVAYCLSLECISLASLSPMETKCLLHFSVIISLSATSNLLKLIFSIPVVLGGFPIALLRIFHVVFRLSSSCSILLA